MQEGDELAGAPYMPHPQPVLEKTLRGSLRRRRMALQHAGCRLDTRKADETVLERNEQGRRMIESPSRRSLKAETGCLEQLSQCFPCADGVDHRTSQKSLGEMPPVVVVCAEGCGRLGVWRCGQEGQLAGDSTEPHGHGEESFMAKGFLSWGPAHLVPPKQWPPYLGRVMEGTLEVQLG